VIPAILRRTAIVVYPGDNRTVSVVRLRYPETITARERLTEILSANGYYEADKDYHVVSIFVGWPEELFPPDAAYRHLVDDATGYSRTRIRNSP
jgi:hypothetical protein